jgi:hypothetical membrane protein
MFNAKHRLTTASALTILVPIVCWLLTAGRGRIPLWIPYVSDLALVEPAATIFPIGMVATGLLFLSLLPDMHRLLPHRSADALYIVASIGVMVVGLFDWLAYPWIHYIAAVLVFSCFNGWAALATCFGERDSMRILLLCISGVLCLSLLALSLTYGEMPVAADDLRWMERPWSMTAAAGIEWLLVLILGLVALSFRSNVAYDQNSPSLPTKAKMSTA